MHFILLQLCFYAPNRAADSTVSVQPISLKDFPPFAHGSSHAARHSDSRYTTGATWFKHNRADNKGQS